MRVLKDRQALVTGAAHGLGRAIALSLAREKTHLWLVDCDARGLLDTTLEARRLGVEVRPIVADLTDRNEVDAVAEEVLKSDVGVDLLINNAGVAYYGGLHKMADSQWDRLMSLNFDAPLQLTRRLLTHLRQRPEAHIVNMCSIAGLVAGGRFTAYHATKFGLLGFTLALRAEYARKGLGVTAICPGACLTNMYRDCVTPDGNRAPEPPRWLSATADQVARKTIQAIRKNRRQVVITPTAHFLHWLNRFFPWVLDLAQIVSHRQLPWYRGKPLHVPSIQPRLVNERPIEVRPIDELPAAEQVVSDWPKDEPEEDLDHPATLPYPMVGRRKLGNTGQTRRAA